MKYSTSSSPSSSNSSKKSFNPRSSVNSIDSNVSRGRFRTRDIENEIMSRIDGIKRTEKKVSGYKKVPINTDKLDDDFDVRLKQIKDYLVSLN